MSETRFYGIGRGMFFFAPLVNGSYEGEIDLGSAADGKLAVAATLLEHISTRSGIKTVDHTVVSELSAKVSFTLDEVNNPELLNLYLMGNRAATSQAASSALSKTLAVAQGRTYCLDARDIGVTKIRFRTGTAAFTVGRILAGATGRGTIQRIVVGSGTAGGGDQAGTLYLSNVTAGFVAGEALVDDNATPGAAVAVAAEVFDAQDLVVRTGTGPYVYYSVGTDFTVIPGSGLITVKTGGAITDGASITVLHGCRAVSGSTIDVMKSPIREGRLRFVSTDPTTTVKGDLVIPKVTIKPTGDLSLVSSAVGWRSLAFEATVMEATNPDGTNVFANWISA